MMIYISGAISSDPHYKKKFKKAEKQLSKHFDVINPAKVNSKMPKNTSYDTYMDLSMSMLKNADAIFMLSDWENSLGARQEYGYALGKGLHVIMEDK